jgi:hypothetical protein
MLDTLHDELDEQSHALPGDRGPRWISAFRGDARGAPIECPKAADKSAVKLLRIRARNAAQR